MKYLKKLRSRLKQPHHSRSHLGEIFGLQETHSRANFGINGQARDCAIFWVLQSMVNCKKV